MLVADDLLVKSLLSVYAGHIYAYAGLVYAGCLIVQTDAKSEAGNSCHKTHYYNLTCGSYLCPPVLHVTLTW